MASAALYSGAMFGEAAEPFSSEPIIDIHQHTSYAGRSNQHLLRHQRALGITTTVLLPAGAKFGLDAGCGGNESTSEVVAKHPSEFVCFANEIADLPNARNEIEKYLKKGAIGIGEQKFRVACDSPHIEQLAELAQEYDVPILMHFWHKDYNTGFDRFHRVLEKYPKVNFIGHAQTWWGNIDKEYNQRESYPAGKVTPGGLTDKLLADYPNVFADLSAQSGLNALIRDEVFTRDFMGRHQDKLLFGTDCNDIFGRGPGCQGAQTLAAVRRLAPNKKAERKILYENAARLLKQINKSAAWSVNP